jgi:DNA-nicking Smr family endonuclease
VLRRLLRELLGLVPALDLHGLGVRDALTQTELFLREMADRGEREVRVVYGKGRGSPGGVGVLRQAVPAWLEQHGGGLVERFSREVDRDGNDGAMRVWLVRRTGGSGPR